MYRKDLTGKSTGKLTVINYSRKEGYKHYWRCQCECGNTTEIVSNNLRFNSDKGTKSCGCSLSINIYINDKYNNLTVKEDLGLKGKNRYFKCICDCGNETEVRGQHLKSGGVKSCGCLNVFEIKNLKHGKTNDKVYKAYYSMMTRCYDFKYHKFQHYGGRGISVCDDWKGNFEQFYKDIGEPPTKQHSVDRIDVNGNYEPSNCRWATVIEQANNKRNNVR